MKQIFQEYISEPKEVSYKAIKKYNGTITKQQALFDLDELRYVLDNRYSGKEYWEHQGIIFDECYSIISSFIQNKDEIYISDLCKVIHHTFDIGIVDNHLSFASPLTGRLHFSKKYTAYFADVIIEKINDDYIVVASKDKALNINDKVDNGDYLYPTLSPVGKKYYLVGCHSWEKQDIMRISIGGKSVSISLHKCRANIKNETNDVCLKQSIIDNIAIIRSNCCDYVYPINRDEDIVAIGKKYTASNTLIWNNLSNEGGYSKIPHDFLLGLNGYVCPEEYCAKLVSPVTEGKDCKREWILTNPAVCERDKGTYNGVLYFLMNSDTASSGETSILYAKSLRNVIFIGENSMGCNTFGNIASYQLTNSSIILRVPNMINLCKNPDDCVEGKGFTPDYWVDNTDVQSEVIRWIKNPDTYMPGLVLS